MTPRTVEQYQDAFDTLLIRIEDLLANHAISCFLSGLTSESQNTVRMFKPQTLHDAYCLAKLQEPTLISIARKKPILDKRPFSQQLHHSTKQIHTPSTSGSSTYRANPPTKTQFTPLSSQASINSRHKRPERAVTAQELDERRAKSLCFYCDQKYMQGHKCKAQIYKIELIGYSGGSSHRE